MSLHVEKNVSPESQPVSRKTHQITCEGLIKQVLFNVTQKDTGNRNLRGRISI